MRHFGFGRNTILFSKPCSQILYLSIIYQYCIHYHVWHELTEGPNTWPQVCVIQRSWKNQTHTLEYTSYLYHGFLFNKNVQKWNVCLMWNIQADICQIPASRHSFLAVLWIWKQERELFKSWIMFRWYFVQRSSEHNEFFAPIPAQRIIHCNCYKIFL